MIPYFTVDLPSIFGFPIQIFGIMVAIGFLVGDYLVKKRALQTGLDLDIIKTVVLICIFVGIISAHVFDCIFYEPRILFTDFREFLDFRTRLSSMGGAIGVSATLWLYFRKKNVSFLEYGDVIVFGWIPGWFFGRVGCFLVHDHPGRLSDFFTAVKFPGGARHDLGLYDALLLGVIWLTLTFVSKRVKTKSFHGFYLSICFVIYAIGRFGFDFLRIHESRMGPLTFAQYVCIPVFFAGLYLIFKKPALKDPKRL